MTYKDVAEIGPVFAENPECPFNCIGCKYFGGIHTYNGGMDVEIECELENN